jgi:hypothetical protein
MNHQLTQHARTVLAERNIPVERRERALTRPALTEPSATDPTLESRFVRIPEHGDRVLRVVVNKQAVPERVVSVHFDRMTKGKL